ncbi:Crp/Fnr family transcriptional regulator [Sphingomonas sp. HMWF008]|nr:Crp/Fnr family transcriptional regulator [Sphingomonas sp. HMWF008]
MTIKHQNTLHEVIASLDRIYPLGSSDRAALEALPFETTEHPAHFYLVREGTQPTACCMLLQGYACRHKITSTGERQIVSFHIPGDMLDVQHLELDRADHNVQTITPVTIAWVPKPDLQQVIDANPTVRTAVLRSALIDASIFREWVLNVGRREAVSRVAHMLCEFVARRSAAGLGSPDCFRLPMTQEDIADATGLTPVHVNRMLQTLGTRGVMTRDKRDVRIVDWEGMRRIADFNPAYLHLGPR